MFAAALTTILLVCLTILAHYEALRFTWLLLPRLTWLSLRARLIVVVFACFAAHTLEVWIYAVAFYLFDSVFGLGSFAGNYGNTLADAVYFSVVTFTSLGLGDIHPLGGTRLIAGVEALNGLLLIAWSASFTYLAMEKFWPLHGDRRR
jgi:hypothetical protein